VTADAMPVAAAYARSRPPVHDAIVRSSHYVTMRDGVRIALDLYLPAGHTGALPTMLRQTRYFRGYDPSWLGRWLGEDRLDPANPRLRRYFVTRGYAWVDVDVRGSGASGGIWHSPWSPLEVRDGAEIVDWIIAQPWSSGRVGTTGNSYDGTAAELLVTTGHPAVRAVAPRCSLYDVYTDIAYPGGVRQAWFTAAWTRANQALDANHPERMISEAMAQARPFWDRGVRRRVLERMLRLVFQRVRPVDGDHAAVTERLDARRANLDVEAASREVEFRDDLQHSGLGPQTVDTFSPSAYLDRQRAAAIPTLSISGWFDGGYPHAAIKRQLSLDQPDAQLVLGPWNHGLSMNVSPHAASRKAGFDLAAELLRFFDRHLLDPTALPSGSAASPGQARLVDRASEPGPAVRYYVMGQEQWRSAPRWPPPEATPRRLYLGDGQLLGESPGSTVARDRLVHDPATGSGRRSRWRTLVSPFVVADYPDRARRGRHLLVYRSAPLAEPLDVAGHPILELHLAADAPDGAVFAYLEDETATAVHYVTEGQVRVIHGLASEPPSYTSPAPYRSFRRRDARALEPGAVTCVRFDLLPVAYRFARGSRIRLALATADADHFAPIPGAASYAVLRGATHPSHLELPAL
jgi:putative CocE/NonD family hydrolase